MKNCGCCNTKSRTMHHSNHYSVPCNKRDCRGRVCKNCNYCNTCYNCNCHSFPGHFMSVERLTCNNTCLVMNYSFNIKKC